MNDFICFSNKDDTKENIKSLLEDYKFTLKSLSKISGLDYLWLTNFVDGKTTLNDLTISDRLSLSNMIFMLSDGISMIDEDVRVNHIIESLVSSFGINLETLAIYARIEEEDVKNFMKDTNSISYEKRYKLSTASLFLHFLFKQPEKIKIESHEE